MQPVSPSELITDVQQPHVGQFSKPNERGQRIIIYAKDQPQYLPLPAVVEADGDLITTKWKLSWAERLRILLTGRLFLQVRIFGHKLQPVKPSVYTPKELL